MKSYVCFFALLVVSLGCDDESAANASSADMGPSGLGNARQRDMGLIPINPATGGASTPSMGGTQAPNGGQTTGGGAESLECQPELACETNGAEECFGQTTTRVCERNPNSGCLEWGAQRLCAVGQVCVEGTCRSPGNNMNGCANQCTPGQTQCDGPNIQLCARDLNGCNVWGESRNCGNGSSCMAGECSGGVNPCQTAGEACPQLNAIQCINERIFRICTRDQNGCLIWGNAGLCNEGTTCTNGQCVADANMQGGGGRNCLFGDLCQPGDVDCVGEFGFSACALSQASQCYEFIGFNACPNGGRCLNGQCQAPEMNDGCAGISDCQIGESRCNGDFIQTCEDFGGCGRWTLGQCMNPAQVCREGQCVNPAGADCANQECVPGQRRCIAGDGFGRFNECTADVSGCGSWDNTPFLCPEGQSCMDSRCNPVDNGNNNPGDNPQCAVDCVVDEQRCSGLNAYEVCRADPLNPGCNTWSSPNPCGSAFECDARTGQCVCEANPNACAQRDAQRCANNNAQVCEATFLSNGRCLAWSNRQLCGVGFICQEAGGQAECAIDNGGGNNNCPNQECIPGQKECVDNDGLGRFYPCEEDFSGCGTWDRDVPILCPGAQVCINQQCVDQ